MKMLKGMKQDEIAKLSENEFMAIAVDESGYSQNQLKAAFDSVCNKQNWKMPIYAVVPETADTKLIARAIEWYTGSSPMFTKYKSLEKPTYFNIQVLADGYYKTIGA